MSTDVVMPQMGESIAEGTIVRWIKKVGDPIDKDEPLFEISTDKVDAEIPSPGAGVLLEIKVKEGETVPVNSVVARHRRGRARRSRRPRRAVRGRCTAATAASRTGDVPAAVGARRRPSATCRRRRRRRAQTLDDLRRTRSSPLVRKIAKEHGIDITQLNGTGISGRVTKKDILGVHRERPRAAAAPARCAGQRGAAPIAAAAGVPAGRERAHREDERDAQEDRRAHGDEHPDVARTCTRRTRWTSAASTSFALGEEGRVRSAPAPKLTYTAFIAKATVDTIRAVPVRQRVDRRREHRLQARHQSRHRRRARAGLDRAGHPQRRRAQHARPVAARFRISRSARARSS